MFPFQFERKQFSVRLSFAMTVNKAQGQTIPNVGVYLPEPVFSHGQLYVALSRATARSNVKIHGQLYTFMLLYREPRRDQTWRSSPSQPLMRRKRRGRILATRKLMEYIQRILSIKRSLLRSLGCSLRWNSYCKLFMSLILVSRCTLYSNLDIEISEYIYSFTLLPFYMAFACVYLSYYNFWLKQLHIITLHAW